MFGYITIREKKIPMEANAATPIRYRQVFHKNLLSVLLGKASEEEGAEAAGELAYIMARSAEKADMSRLSYEDYISWLEGFEPLDLVNDKIVTDIMNIYQGNMATDAEVKKSPDQPSGK